MPQMIPFHFLSQVTYGFILLFILLYLLSKYFLPNILKLYLSRLYILSLFK